MKSIQLHPMSVVLGALALGLCLFVSSAAQSVNSVQRLSAPGGVVRIEGIPTPGQMMRVVEGTPFTVPVGKLFVVTGAMRTQDVVDDPVDILFDLAPVGSVYAGLPNRVVAIPPGLVAGAGESVSCITPPGETGVLLGYLADA